MLVIAKELNKQLLTPDRVRAKNSSERFTDLQVSLVTWIS